MKNGYHHQLRALGSAALVALLLAACQPSGQTRTLVLETLNDSGVTGMVTLTEVGQSQTRIDVRVEPAGNLDMPAHVHPGSCVAHVPQPKFPLASVTNGSSTTVVPAALSKLVAGDLALNLHHSNDDATYTACVDLR